MKRLSKSTVSDQMNQTLAKALLMLEAFTEENPVWGIRELSRHLDTNPTTVYRLAATFQNAGYMEQDPETQRYRLGSRFLKLANVYVHENPLPKIARKIFETYADRFDYNFYLGALSHFEVVYLAILDGRGPIKVVAYTGGTIGLHSTALGKVLLAFQDDQFIHEFIDSGGLEALTPKTITNSAQLWDEIHTIREKRYAINVGESFQEIGALGVPVGAPGEKPELAISLAYPQHLADSNQINVGDLIELAREIVEEIDAAHKFFK